MLNVFEVNGRLYAEPARPVLAICADGWDPEYVDDALERGLMPRLAETLADGSYAIGRSQVPTFTNPNNVTIVTGVSAAVNGVAGNHYRTPAGEEVQVTGPSFLRARTIHDVAQESGVRVLCVTAKDKLRALLATGGVPTFSAEKAHEQALADGTPVLDAHGVANPEIYDWPCRPTPSIWFVWLAQRLPLEQLVARRSRTSMQHSTGRARRADGR